LFLRSANHSIKLVSFRNLSLTFIDPRKFKMTKSILVAALFAVGLVACGKKQEAAPAAAPAPAPAATEQKPADAAATPAAAPAAAPAAEPAKK
jgi:hypothetical protein